MDAGLRIHYYKSWSDIVKEFPEVYRIRWELCEQTGLRYPVFYDYNWRTGLERELARLPVWNGTETSGQKRPPVS
jgi:hypothetical protein